MSRTVEPMCPSQAEDSEDQAPGTLILGKHYDRLCGISFPYAGSHSSRLAIFAQGRDA